MHGIALWLLKGKLVVLSLGILLSILYASYAMLFVVESVFLM